MEDFVWREGEIRRATCEVCGNSDVDAFSLPEEFEQDMDEEVEDAEGEEDEEDEDDEESEYLDDHDEDEEDEEED
ncbi:MAG: hypothetical protein A2Y78_13220 [Acidobacteria bacterium RBG_13_68_16]|nr:MAG: hypothetical protein A2Y78_13220 [Acidobacteria bacterium RBG_13_68_16]